MALVAFVQFLTAMDTKNTVSVLRSQGDPLRHYTGLTSDLEKRLTWHNAAQTITGPERRQNIDCRAFTHGRR